MSSSTNVRVRDARTPPFSYVTHDALDALHTEFGCRERSSAMAIYLALAALSSRARGRGVRGGEFTATNEDVGEVAGVSGKTVERYAPRFERAGLLEREQSPGKVAIWLLTEPHEDVDDSSEEDPTPDMVSGVEVGTPDMVSGDPRHGVGGLVNPRTGRDEELKKERETAPATAICDRIERHVLHLDPAAQPDPTSTAWRYEAVALLEQDRRPLDQVLSTIDWIAEDAFWAARILSPRDLRKHFGRIIAVRAGESAIRRAGADATRQRKRDEKLEHAGHCCLAVGAAPSAAEDDWRRLAPELREVLGQENFERWLTSAHAHVGADGELLLAVSPVVEAWIRDRFGLALDKVAGRRLDIVICEETT